MTATLPNPTARWFARSSRTPHESAIGQVLAVREAAGSDKAAFEVILTAAIGAGLARWDAAQRAITEAKDAAP